MELLDDVIERLEIAWEQLAAIREIQKESVNLDIDKLYELGLEKAMSLVDANKGFLVLPKDDDFKPYLSKGADAGEFENIIKESAKRRRPVWEDSILTIPLVAQREVIGVIGLYNKEKTFSIDDMKLVMPFLYTLASTIQSINLANELRLISARAAHKIGTRMAILEAPYLRLKKKLAGSELEKDVESLSDVIEGTRKTLTEFTSLSAPLELTIQKVDLNEVLRKIVVSDEKIRVRFILPSKLIIEGDGAKLEDLFLELTANARSAMEYGEIIVKVETSKDWVKIKFIDTGRGIPEEDKLRIFEPFFGRKGSSGMGLSIVKHIIDAHKGRIEEKGAPGKGAMFVIDLPMKQRERDKTISQ